MVNPICSFLFDILILFFLVKILLQQLKNPTFIDALKQFRLKDKSYVTLANFMTSFVIFTLILILLWNYRVSGGAHFNINSLLVIFGFLFFITFIIAILYCLFVMGKAIYYAFSGKELNYKDGYQNKNFWFYDKFYIFLGICIVVSIIANLVSDFIKIL